MMVRKSPRLSEVANVADQVEPARRADVLPLAVGTVGDHEVVQQRIAGDIVNVEVAEAAADGGLQLAAAVDESNAVSDGVVVHGAAQRRDQLVSKMFAQGVFRAAAKITGLLPHGGGGRVEWDEERPGRNPEAGANNLSFSADDVFYKATRNALPWTDPDSDGFGADPGRMLIPATWVESLFKKAPGRVHFLAHPAAGPGRPRHQGDDMRQAAR